MGWAGWGVKEGGASILGRNDESFRAQEEWEQQNSRTQSIGSCTISTCGERGRFTPN